MRHAALKLIAVSVLLVLIPTLICAQEVASVTGVVTDSTGAVVPGVQVTLVNTGKSITYQGTTNSAGVYTISKVLPGPGYKMTFKKDGFDVVVVNELYVNVGVTRTQNAELRIGKVTETVEVSAVGEGVALNTTDATVGNSFNMNSVAQLPVQVRDNPAALLQLQPGVVNATGGSDGLSSRAGSVTGARGDQNNVTLDGLDVNDFATGQAFSTVGNAPVESIQEFHGETAGSLAASGRGSGGQIQMVTKSGTNQFHGSLAEYHRNTLTTANSWFNNNAGIEKPALIRNQFGATLGGPAIKDKLFFFFNYNGRRDAYSSTAVATVPLDSMRSGNIHYILAHDANGNTCASTSKLLTTPQCIGTLTPTQIAALDPKGIGVNNALLTYINQRYPHANDLTGGDGINTGAYRFNSPVHRVENDYVGRVDYNMSTNQQLFGRFSILRDRYGDNVNYAAPVQFPGDPLTHSIANTSYAYVIGHTWTISSTKVNKFTYGETVSRLAFPTGYNPTGTTTWSFGGLTAPYSDQSSQARKNPIPVFRDDFNWQRGRHNIQIGGTFKPIKTTSTLVGDFNSVAVGLGGNTSNLSAALRPTDIRTLGTVSSSVYDTAFAFLLGRFASVGSNWNYNGQLSVLPQGTGATRQYRYWETEAYIQDSWKVNNALSLTYGLRYQYYSVPYETNGAEAIQNFGFNDYLFGRAAQGMAGVSGVDAVPIIQYDLGGKANNAQGLYEPNLTDFAPRLSFNYSPSATTGWLGRILGDRKTVIRGGAGIIHDHPVVNALNFIQDQNSYMFQSSSSVRFGSTNPVTALTNDPRFTAIDSIPTPAPAPVVSRPFLPYVTDGVPDGLAGNQFNYAIDPKLKSPYSIVMSFGIQRELPHHFVFETTYVGRLGRRLIAQADASQLVDFRDPSSGQLMSAAFANLTQQLRNGANLEGGPAIVPVPWFENQMANIGYPGGNTQLLADYISSLVSKGDVADAVQWIAANGLIDYNVGMPSQFAGNTYITNKGSSNYHGLLTTLHKNMSNGLQFDLNYTLSHSIDNSSMISNSIASNSGMGYICDAQNPRICRGNSDFDIRHIVNGTFIYDLPFGKGKAFGSGATGAVNHLIGGWTVSGIPTWRSGIAFSTVSGAYLMGYANNAPAIFNGDWSAIAVSPHKTADGKVTFFKDPTAAADAFSGPIGFEMGSRNNLHGPGYFNLDLRVAKHFQVTERVKMLFVADAFNALNHASFGLPGSGYSGAGADISSSNFGQITGTSSTARVMQWGLRLEF